MKQRYEKSIHILTDLMGFCHFLGADKLHCDLSLEDGKTIISVSAELEQLAQEQLDEMAHVLNIPRQREVEQNFWGICGEEDIDTELSLAGMMIDKAQLRYEHGVLHIHAERIETTGER